MLGLLLASMLVQSDIRALQSAKLSPNAVNSIAALQGSTPRILDRATFATYAGGTPQFTVMSYSFAPGEIQAGSQIHFKVGGTFVNDSGGVYLAGAVVFVTGGTTTALMGTTAQAATTGAGANAIRAWETDCTIAASIAGADGQYLPNLKSGTAATATVKQSASLAFTNVCKQFISDSTVAGSPDYGGLILNTLGNGSRITSTLFQQTFSLASPIQISVVVTPPVVGTGSQSRMTIQMGYMEGL